MKAQRTPEPRQSFGSAAERFNLEQKLGAAVVRALIEYAARRRDLGFKDHPVDPKSHPIYAACLREARRLGLLDATPEVRP